MSDKQVMTNETQIPSPCAATKLSLSVIRLAGADRAKFLHNFCTADINKLQADQCSEAFFLNPKGKTICFGIVVSREVDLLIITTAKSTEVLMQSLDMYLLSDDVQLSDATALWRSVFVYGPEAEKVLSDSEIRVPAEGAVANTGFQMVLQAELAGQGVLILEPVEGDVDVASKLTEKGAVDYSIDAMHIARIASQTPWCDSEVTDACLPQEFRRDAKAISFTKGCYLGQETVARLDALGHVNRFMTGFEIVSGEVSIGDVLRKDEKKVGLVTSLAETSDGKKIGLGFLKVELVNSGEEVQCEGVSLLIG